MASKRHRRFARRTASVERLPHVLENVLESLGDCLILTDEEDRITMFNQAAQELTGRPAAPVLARACAAVFAASPTVGAMPERTRLSGQSQSCGEETLTLPHRRIPVRLSCSPIRDGANRVQGTALVIQDLSYQKKLEDEARRNETLARLGGLVAGLAHEVKNPLGGIRGAAQLLAKRFSDQPEVGEYTGVMIREIDRLSRLVEQLLTLGAPPTPDAIPVNVHKIIHEVLALLASELSAKQIRKRLEIDPSLPDVRGDEDQLTHVFLNLVKNALEAMPEQGTLTITTRMETDFHILRRAEHGTAGFGPDLGAVGPGKFLRVEVADTGPGFAPEAVERAFEPFFTTKPRGRIVAVHGGDIRAENGRGGSGGVVTVTLPLV
jgi:two-component system nitrogen regulation sensor histidine kinase GlnL